jgi:hypothetical protein
MDKQKKLAALEVKRSQINAQIQAIKARENGQQRKDDTRRKVLIGSVVLKMLKTGEMPQERLNQLLDKHLETERDRKLFGLEQKQQEQKEPLTVA